MPQIYDMGPMAFLYNTEFYLQYVLQFNYNVHVRGLEL